MPQDDTSLVHERDGNSQEEDQVSELSSSAFGLIYMGMFWTLTNAASIVLIAEFVSTLTTISFLLMELIKASDKSEQVLLM